MSTRDQERAARTAQAATVPTWPLDFDGGYTMVSVALICTGCSGGEDRLADSVTVMAPEFPSLRKEYMRIGRLHREKYGHTVLLTVLHKEERRP